MPRTMYIVAIMLCTAVVLTGCGSDDDNPPPPSVGTVQIDRMGRAGVNTALTNPFYRESVASEDNQHKIIVDDYNVASDPSQWVARFSSLIASNLAILDSLDRVCGNQVLAGPAPVAGRYRALADILADDQLYVNTASGTCNQWDHERRRWHSLADRVPVPRPTCTIVCVSVYVAAAGLS
jgi:hypothetical protein